MERKEAIEIVRKLYNESLFLKKDKEAIVTLIPELAESKDEEIRKELIAAFQNGVTYNQISKAKAKDYIAWLEKQGEQKPAEWSKEDEQLYNDLSDTYFYNDEDYPKETYKLMLKRVLDWMTKRAKSLRPQSTWKPSEEEMKALEFCLEYNIDKDGVFGSKVVKLYDELKKLKG